MRPGPFQVTLLLSAGLLALACGGCAMKASRSEVVSALGEVVSTSRDSSEHVGPTFRDVPPEIIEAAAKAPDDESFRRNLVKLLDQLEDGHAKVEPDDKDKLAMATGIALVELEGTIWIGFYEPIRGFGDLMQWNGIAPEGGGEGLHVVREWMRLDEIDGYAPQRLQSAICLLEGLPQSSVEVAGTLSDGTTVRRTLLRGPRNASIIVSSGSSDRLGAFYLELSNFVDPVPMPAGTTAVGGRVPFVRSARIGPDGRTGYLRLDRMQSGDDHSCGKIGDICEDRAAIAAAIDPLIGCDAIILDLGGNGGGTCVHGAEVMRRLLPRSLERVPFRHVNPLGEAARWQVDAPERRFGGQLIVIADEGTASAAEHLVNILKGAPGVTVVGSPTGGLEFSLIPLKLRDTGLRLQIGGTPTVWDPPRQSSEGRPVEPDIVVPVDPRVRESFGPLAALTQRRIDTLAAAWRVAGLRGPEGGTFADLRSLVPWRVWPALGRLLVWAVVILAAVVTLLVWLRARRRRARALAAALA
jgi:hypothetical protein